MLLFYYSNILKEVIIQRFLYLLLHLNYFHAVLKKIKFSSWKKKKMKVISNLRHVKTNTKFISLLLKINYFGTDIGPYTTSSFIIAKSFKELSKIEMFLFNRNKINTPQLLIHSISLMYRAKQDHSLSFSPFFPPNSYRKKCFQLIYYKVLFSSWRSWFTGYKERYGFISYTSL